MQAGAGNDEIILQYIFNHLTNFMTGGLVKILQYFFNHLTNFMSMTGFVCALKWGPLAMEIENINQSVIKFTQIGSLW